MGLNPFCIRARVRTYAAAMAAAAGLGADWREVFPRLVVMESEALRFAT